MRYKICRVCGRNLRHPRHQARGWCERDYCQGYGDATEPITSGAWQWSGCTASGEQHHSYVEIWHYQRREPGEQRCTAQNRTEPSP